MDSISPALFSEITNIVKNLPKRQTQSELNNDFYWLLTEKGWSYDTLSGITSMSPKELGIGMSDRRAICVDGVLERQSHGRRLAAWKQRPQR